MNAHPPLEMVENHLTSLRRLATQLARDPHDADDVLQETWLLAMQSPPRGLDRVRVWLETVLRNVVRRRHRQAQRRNGIRTGDRGSRFSSDCARRRRHSLLEGFCW
jgi:DNA-directed RNA polymerase specialized sigma24 family protein